jgi:hypothetical protein
MPGTALSRYASRPSVNLHQSVVCHVAKRRGYVRELQPGSNDGQASYAGDAILKPIFTRSPSFRIARTSDSVDIRHAPLNIQAADKLQVFGSLPSISPQRSLDSQEQASANNLPAEEVTATPAIPFSAPPFEQGQQHVEPEDHVLLGVPLYWTCVLAILLQVFTVVMLWWSTWLASGTALTSLLSPAIGEIAQAAALQVFGKGFFVAVFLAIASKLFASFVVACYVQGMDALGACKGAKWSAEDFKRELKARARIDVKKWQSDIEEGPIPAFQFFLTGTFVGCTMFLLIPELLSILAGVSAFDLLKKLMIGAASCNAASVVFGCMIYLHLMVLDWRARGSRPTTCVVT